MASRFVPTGFVFFIDLVVPFVSFEIGQPLIEPVKPCILLHDRCGQRMPFGPSRPCEQGEPAAPVA